MGHRRDFYRVADAGLDPLFYERAFGRIEAVIAPLLKSLYKERRVPTERELDDLLAFAAIAYARVPSFRPRILAVADSFHRGWFSEALKSPESWAAALATMGIPADSPGSGYEKVREFERKGYSLSAENDWYLYRGFEEANHVIPLLKERQWEPLLSSSGSFIGSDVPVMLDGPKGQLVGFKSADVVLFQVSRHLVLFGTKIPIRPVNVTRRYIAEQNTFTMLTTDEQVYSHEPDFCWLDSTGHIQTDWTLFSKETS